MDYAANLASFLSEKTGTVCGFWYGKLSAKAQRELFGRYLGKGNVVIDGKTERLTHSRTVCFGTDFEITADLAWRNL
jgi:hypothetical protein